MKNRIIWLLILFCMKGHAQVSDTILPVEQYNSLIRKKMQTLTFLKPEKSSIQYHEALTKFYQKLNSVSKQPGGKVNIVHLGDSHIQAGYFSGMVRRGLQHSFGNAGRGFVFPYRLAKSNGPHDYVSFSSNQWKAYRNVNTPDTIPTGVSGFVVTATDSLINFGISLRNNEGVNYSFNKIQLFSSFVVPSETIVTDSTGVMNAVFEDAGTAGISNYKFQSDVTNVLVNAKNVNTVFSLYGLNLLNDNAGVVYHTIGVNGAEYGHFLRQPLFLKQVKELNADLYILSFGTNEAFSKSFSENAFLQTVDSTIQALRKVSPEACFLITSPAESCVRVKKGRFAPNPNVAVVREALKNYCQKNKIAFYDLYECVGGKGSMLKIAKAHMSDARRIHFTRTGYEILGLMFLDALMQNTDVK